MMTPSRIFRYHVPASAWETNLNAAVRAYVEVALTVSLDDAAGPRLQIQPGLEAVTKVEAGRAQHKVDQFNEDLTLMAAKAGTEAGDYLVGPEDLIEVTLYNIEDVSGEPRLIRFPGRIIRFCYAGCRQSAGSGLRLE